MTNTLMATQNNAVRQQAIVSHRWVSASDSIKGTSGLTATNVITIPRFGKAQRVSFVGGVGVTLYFWPDSGTWTYAVQMEMGPEPEMGRIGSETTILLNEADIHEVMN